MRGLPLMLLGATLLLPMSATAVVADDCVDGNDVFANGFQWSPPCIRIVSGDAITWSNPHSFQHDLRSAQDDVAALRAVAPACFAAGRLFPGDEVMIRFVAAANGVSASIRNADGTWEPANDCRLASAPSGVVGQAEIPYKCALHGGMTGRIVVVPLQVG